MEAAVDELRAASDAQRASPTLTPRAYPCLVVLDTNAKIGRAFKPITSWPGLTRPPRLRSRHEYWLPCERGDFVGDRVERLRLERARRLERHGDVAGAHRLLQPVKSFGRADVALRRGDRVPPRCFAQVLFDAHAALEQDRQIV